MPFPDLDDAAARFASCCIPKGEWTHLAHLAIGAWHVHRYGADVALAHLRVGIRRLNESHGTPNSATHGYHETITRAYVQLLSQFLDSCPAAMSLAQRVAELFASPLADKDVLFRFYSRQRLISSEARAQWLEPDIKLLRVADVLPSAGGNA